MQRFIRRRHRGFTLIEMLFVVILVGVVTGIIAQYTQPGIAAIGKTRTDFRLEELRRSLVAAYREQATTIDAAANTGAVFAMTGGTIAQVLPDAARRCPSNATTLLPLGPFLPGSASELFRDGHAHPMCVFITPPQTATILGVQVGFRSIAIVSTGFDSVLDATTALSATGTLTIGGDDKGILVDGRSMAQDRVRETTEKMDRIVNALQAYFNARYLANAARDISINYFASTNRAGSTDARFDTGGALASSQGAAMSMTLMGAHTALGLSVADVTDGYGQVFLLDNSSNTVRNPENSTTALQTPAYTAQVRTTLPGGVIVSRTAVGAF